jgi:15-cis-phytoene synthase
MQFQFERAAACYDSALAALPAACTARAAPRAGDGGDLSHAAGRNPPRRFPVLRARVSLTPMRKLWLAGKTWLFP